MQNQRLMILLILAFVVTLSACAQMPKNLQAGGSLETYGAAYPEVKSFKNKPKAENLYVEAKLRTHVKYKPNEKLFFYAQTEICGDTAGFTRGITKDVAERTGRRQYANVREAYGEFKHDWLNVRIGKQIINHSVTDTTSPIDFFCPRDWTDIIRHERVGVPAAKVRIGNTTYFEAAFTPFFTPSKLPVNGGRWERELPRGFENASQELPGRYRSQIGLWAGTTLKGFDLKAGYFNGYSYSPSVRVAPVSRENAELVPAYRQQQVVALAAAREIKGFNVRLEAAYFNQKQDDNFIQLVAGIDKQWSGLFGESDRLYVLGQYADELITKHGNPLSSFGAKPVDFRRALNGAVMLKAQYSRTSERRWIFKAEGAYNIRHGDCYIEPAVVYRWIEKNIEFEGGIDFLFGPKKTFFGGYNDNNRGFLKVTYRF